MKQNNKAFSKSLEKRTKQFTIRIYRLVGQFEYSKSNQALESQLFRSASSIGANYREANRSRSKADFRSKIRICESEASETFYLVRNY
ncbi:MAG: four helix bundle protein [Flavobacteriales bacterium]|nr:four helix bundle protein [Flavobacteriales bacterium]